MSDNRNLIKKIIMNFFHSKKENELATEDEIFKKVKENSQLARLKENVLSLHINNILNEIKFAKKAALEAAVQEAENKANSNSNKNDKDLLGKKRKNEQPIEKKDESEEFLFEPTINLSDLGGMDEIVLDIQETIGNPLSFFNLYKYMNIEPVKGILLCGPPGCGKTTIAHAIGGEYKIPFFKITAPQIISSLSGESENKIRKLFSIVENCAPSILFIDEIESILGKRENASKDMERRIVATITTCIDEIGLKSDNKAPVFVIGATSKPEFIDSSVRRSGRFDKEIHIGFPNENMREKMLFTLVKNKVLDKEINFNKLAKLTPGYLAADLQSLIREAGRIAIKRILDENKNFSENDFFNISNNEETKMKFNKFFENLIIFRNENLNKGNTITETESHPDEIVESDVKQEKKVNIDSLSLKMNDFEEASKNIQPTSKREGFTTIPNVTWSDIGGLEKLRNELYFDIVMPILEPHKLKSVGIDRAVGVLLYGPPGCGKTLLAKAVANEAKSNFISIKGPELLNKYVGESEKAVRQLFIRARNSSPCIIFFDELDALCPKRSMENNAATERVVNQLLTEMDGLEERKQVFIIAATNRPDIIDPAMLRPGRLDKLHFVPLPDEEDRLSIISTILKKLPLKVNCNLDAVFSGKRLEGYSGADMASLVRETQMICLRRSMSNSSNDKVDIISVDGKIKEKEEILMEKSDFETALIKIMPSVSKQDKEKYEHLQKSLKESRSHIDQDPGNK